ncbi:MAG: DUF4384 domain-containing protein [bacterium]
MKRIISLLVLTAFWPVAPVRASERLINQVLGLRPETQDLEITVELDRKGLVYHEGDPVSVSFEVDKDCYLTLLDVAPDGSVTVLFPNLLSADNFVRSGRKYRLLEHRSYSTRVSGGPGKEILKAVAVLSSLELVDLRDLTTVFKTFEKEDAEALRKEFGDLSARLEKKKWAEKTVRFDILPAQAQVSHPAVLPAESIGSGHGPVSVEETGPEEFKVW